MRKDSLGDRMKGYENVTRNYLVKRTPVIIRIDGKAFHSFTRGFEEPFDYILIDSMQSTMKYLCENIQGCMMGYCQSDEISLLLVDYQTIDTSAWFDNNILKLVSVSSSMATMAFNYLFQNNVMKNFNPNDYNVTPYWSKKEMGGAGYFKQAMFDSRAFNIPKEEVCNYFIWRQNDATRNSIQMVGQSKFSHRELEGKNCNQIQEMLFQKYGINWGEDYGTPEKRGSCCVKKDGEWTIDKDIPIFTQDRDYINKFVFLEE